MRILVAPGVGPGRVFPLLAIAAELKRRGHRVDLYAEPGAEKAARAAGCRFTAMPLGDTHEQMLDCVTSADAKRLFEVLAWRVAPHLLQVLERERIEVVVSDVLHLGAALAAQAAGVRWATVATAPSLLGPDMKKTAQAKVPSGPLRKKLGLEPSRDDSVTMATSGQLHLLCWTKELDLSAPPPQSVHVGPLGFEWKKAKAPRWLPAFERGPQRVLVGVSTVPFRALQEAVSHYVSEAIRALNELPVQAVITLADEEYTVTAAPAKHVRVERFVPHALLMPHLSALVTHGGWGTIGRALGVGVPLVVVPFALDQPFNAQLVEARGLGFALPYHALTAEDLYDRLLRLLRDDAPERAAARAQAARWAKVQGPRLAADRVLAL
ncbi:MAG: hypothetical protein IPJ65_21015 [Archangiaceae bacterium]|nr:hypothetical protein [Archangiaceae bacterium]